MTVCAFLLLAATAVDPLSSDVDLCGRAERDNWGVPTMFGRKGSPAVVHPPVRAPEADVFSLNQKIGAVAIAAFATSQMWYNIS